jgi:hypothetical protein
MYSVTQKTANGLVALNISGKMSAREYMEICSLLREAVEQHEHVDLLWELDGFYGWNLFVLWKAANVATASSIDLRRVAVVGERHWHSRTRPLVRAFHGETRYFELSQRTPALRWLRTGHVTPRAGGRIIGRVRRFDKPSRSGR